jgi:hypothetical protein
MYLKAEVAWLHEEKANTITVQEALSMASE